jgi:hypothetical protein
MCDVQSFLPGPLKAKMFDAAAKFLSTAQADDIKAVAADLSKRIRSDTQRAGAATTLRLVADALRVGA